MTPDPPPPFIGDVKYRYEVRRPVMTPPGKQPLCWMGWIINSRVLERSSSCSTRLTNDVPRAAFTTVQLNPKRLVNVHHASFLKRQKTFLFKIKMSKDTFVVCSEPFSSLSVRLVKHIYCFFFHSRKCWCCFGFFFKLYHTTYITWHNTWWANEKDRWLVPARKTAAATAFYQFLTSFLSFILHSVLALVVAVTCTTVTLCTTPNCPSFTNRRW